MEALEREENAGDSKKESAAKMMGKKRNKVCEVVITWYMLRFWASHVLKLE